MGGARLSGEQAKKAKVKSQKLKVREEIPSTKLQIANKFQFPSTQ